jgi:hypothetical protein
MKVVNASHANGICKYNNVKRKLMNYKVNIYFRNSCLNHKLIPNKEFK